MGPGMSALSRTTTTTISVSKKDVATNSQQSVSRITDVVPANFLCDSRAMEHIAQSKMKDEEALCSIEENLGVLKSRPQSVEVDHLTSDAIAEQTRLRCSIDAHRCLLSSSPVSTVPAEVLSEIFLHYIALSRPAHGSIFDEIRASHYILTPILLVCRRWRTTGLADPRLWTTIPLVGSGEGSGDEQEVEAEEEEETAGHPLIDGSPQEKAVYWKGLQRRIERTSALPLHLIFYYNQEGLYGDLKYAIPSLQTFIRLFSRAHSISIKVDDVNPYMSALMPIIDAAEISPAPRVRTARVDVADEAFERKILSAIPNIEILEVGSPNIGRKFMDVPISGHRLRSLHLLTTEFSPMPLVKLLDLLDRAPFLETLKLPRVSTTPSDRTLRVVTHTLLSTFHLASATVNENDAVFSHLTLPALQSLSIGLHHRTKFWPLQSNMGFFNRSKCMLTELVFRGCPLHEQRMLVLLSKQRSLVTLQLNLDDGEEGAAIPMGIVSFLSTKPKGSDGLSLRALTILGLVVIPRQLKAVKEMIETLSSDHAMLKEVRIQVNTKQWDHKVPKAKHTAMFKALVQEGIRIGIEYCGIRFLE